MVYTGVWVAIAIPLVWSSKVIRERVKWIYTFAFIFQIIIEPIFWWQLIPPITWFLAIIYFLIFEYRKLDFIHINTTAPYFKVRI